MFAGESALELAHQGAGFFGDGAHFFRPVTAHVEDRTHVQRAHRGMRIPGAARAVFFEHLGQPLGIFGEMFQRYGAILDEGHRLAVAFHRHHDVESGFAHFPDVALQCRVAYFRHGSRIAQITHHLRQARKIGALRGFVFTGEFHQQNSLRFAPEKASHDGRERGVAARQVDHGAVNQFDCGGIERNDMPGQIHGLMKTGEMHHTEHLVRGQRRELQSDAFRERQRAFRTDQQVREIVLQRLRRAAGLNHVQVVTLNAAQDLGPVRIDLGGFAAHHGVNFLHQRAISRRSAGQLAAGAEMELVSACEPGVDAEHVMHHVAVANGACAAGIVAGHAADGRLRGSRHVHRKPQLARAQPGIQMVQNHAGLHDGFALVEIHIDDFIEILCAIDNQRRANTLAALRAAGPARQNGHTFFGRDLQCTARGILGARHHHAYRIDLVDRGIGAIASARESVEQHLAIDLAPQAPLQSAGRGCGANYANRDGRCIQGRAGFR